MPSTYCVLCTQLMHNLFAIAKFLFTFLNIGRYAFYTIYCHSSGGDTAAALAEFALSESSCLISILFMSIVAEIW